VLPNAYAHEAGIARYALLDPVSRCQRCRFSEQI